MPSRHQRRRRNRNHTKPRSFPPTRPTRPTRPKLKTSITRVHKLTQLFLNQTCINPTPNTTPWKELVWTNVRQTTTFVQQIRDVTNNVVDSIDQIESNREELNLVLKIIVLVRGYHMEMNDARADTQYTIIRQRMLTKFGDIVDQIQTKTWKADLVKAEAAFQENAHLAITAMLDKRDDILRGIPGFLEYQMKFDTDGGRKKVHDAIRSRVDQMFGIV